MMKFSENEKYFIKIIVFFIILFISIIPINNIVFSQDEQENIEFVPSYNFNIVSSNIDLLKSIHSDNSIKEELFVEKNDIDYTTHYRNNSTLEKGKLRIVQEGIDGIKYTNIKRIYDNDNNLISEVVLSEETIKNPRDKIIEIGTKEKNSLKKSNNTPSDGKNGLTFDINLSKPSGFTYEQFVKVLSGNSNDKNKIIEENAEFFYYAEQQYGINGIFLASVAIHESGWGTSKICLDKKNLFGYGAYDSAPYENAKTFENYSEGIDLLARVFKKYYLSENGSFYNGTTLSAVNKKYATDTSWATKVYSHMKTLYANI